ncbi:MAG TPA: FtsH protease activity modulator HflK [Hyphomonas sp.]|nr:FtsH protease activity modulator HflK [Hyphomonas sp.]MCB9961062.1 FtsH protease activity modulator HflK [Hyphomonas sp.]MCB9970353.1 FtsH protease activity modulator HflK [Hyphomonas sp.]HPE48512.1 FtsH protease activity modulator HflK [Hyphomonas sp.]
MPWDDKTKGSGPWGGGGGGGGGDKGGDGNSPWKRPAGGGGGDLEEQMKRMQERFRQRGNGGGGGRRRRGGGSPNFGPLGIFVLIGIGLLAWLATGVVVVDEGSRAAVFRFGQWQTNFTPGLHFHLPAPIETHVVMPSEKQQETRIGSDSNEALMLTGDENIVEVRFRVFWFYDPSNPERFILNVDDGAELLKASAESVMREVVGKSKLNDVITTGRSTIQAQVKTQLQALMNDYQAGIQVQNVEIQEAAAPQQVRQAFIDVVNAGQDAEKAIQEANKYANDITPRAEGQAQQVLQNAEAYKEQVIANATGEAARFNSILDEYRKAPQVTRERMYLETMERVLSNTDKMVLDSKSGAVPYLPIDPSRSATPSRQQGQ